jgi:hypothetical protein
MVMKQPWWENGCPNQWEQGVLYCRRTVTSCISITPAAPLWRHYLVMTSVGPMTSLHCQGHCVMNRKYKWRGGGEAIRTGDRLHSSSCLVDIPHEKDGLRYVPIFLSYVSDIPLASVSRPALRPTQLPTQWVPEVLSQGVKRGRGATLTTHHI